MGVKGLWSILESARQEVDLERFRGKRIAIGNWKFISLNPNCYRHEYMVASGIKVEG